MCNKHQHRLLLFQWLSIWLLLVVVLLVVATHPLVVVVVAVVQVVQPSVL
jgi:hypothetical protein